MGQRARLRRRAEFQRVYRDGVRIVGEFLVLFFAEGEGGVCRTGVTVTRRVGGAVVRNRVRRRIRELMRRLEEGTSGLSGDLVVNARIGCEKALWVELEEDWLRCLGRLRRRVSWRELR